MRAPWPEAPEGTLEDIDVAVWVDDATSIRELVGRWETSGEGALRVWLEEHPDELVAAIDGLRPLWVSPGAVRLYGAESAAALIAAAGGLRPAEGYDAALNLICAVARGDTSDVGETIAQTVSGARLHLHTRVRWRERQGRLELIRTEVDVTPKRRAEERLARGVERARAATWATDREGSIVVPQPAWEAFTGQGWAASRRNGWVDVVHPEDRARLEAVWDRCRDNALAFFGEGRLRRVGEEGWRRFVGRAEPIFVASGAVRGWSWHLIDIEDERRDAELERANHELEQFAFVASHDLTEPLRTVASYCDLLREGASASLPPRERSWLDFVAEAVGDMQGLVEDLLAYARIQGGDVVQEAVPLGDAARAATRGLAALIEATGATVDIGELPTIVGDRRQWQRLFGNLIGNALKYRGDDPPQVQVAAGREGEGWRVWVEDNGPGVDPAWAEAIFGAYVRGPGPRLAKGTGLGLAICRRIVEGAGGTIRVASRPGAGSSFIITLPGDAA